MNTTNLIIILVCVPLIIFYIWNTYTLQRISTRRLSNQQLNDSKYFELKYKIQFLVSMFLVVSSTASIVGYNLIQQAKTTAKTEIETDLQSMRDSINDYKKEIANDYIKAQLSLNSTNNNVAQYNQIIATLLKEQGNIARNYSEYRDSLKYLNLDLGRNKKIIDEINSKPILQRDIYIVNAGAITLDTIINGQSVIFNGGIDTIYFASLQTVSGDRLPIFKKPPILSILSTEGAVFSVIKSTNEYFVFDFNSISGVADIPKKVTLYLLVTEDR